MVFGDLFTAKTVAGKSYVCPDGVSEIRIFPFPFVSNVSCWLVWKGWFKRLILCIGIDSSINSFPKLNDVEYPTPAVVPSPTDSFGLK